MVQLWIQTDFDRVVRVGVSKKEISNDMRKKKASYMKNGVERSVSGRSNSRYKGCGVAKSLVCLENLKKAVGWRCKSVVEQLCLRPWV
jgi:hypothetical protein